MRDFLHLSAIRTWQALAGGRPAPDLDPDLEQVIDEAFVTSDGRYQVDQLCDGWLELARQCGIAVEDQDGELRLDVLDAISPMPSRRRSGSASPSAPEANGRYAIRRKFLTLGMS